MELEADPDNFASRDRDDDWVDLYVGGRAIWRLSEKFAISTQGTIGGFGSDFAWTAEGLLEYYLTSKVSIFGGYRALSRTTR